MVISRSLSERSDHISLRFALWLFASEFPSADVRACSTGVWGLIQLENQNHVRTLPDIFNLGLSLSRDGNFLGHRPVVSTNPLKFADHYVWQSYAQVDERRRNLGSAIHKLFSDGVLGGGELQTVGIWSQNRPGEVSFVMRRSRVTHAVVCSIRVASN